MTRKDFDLIAKALKSARAVERSFGNRPEAVEGVELAARCVAGELQDTNPRFDRERFLTACGVQPTLMRGATPEPA